MLVLRAFTGSVLTTALLAGQLLGLRCPMAAPTESAAADHAQLHQEDHADGAARAKTGTTGTADLPGPCVMSVNCGTMGIAQAMMSIDSYAALQAQSTLWLAFRYTDPVVLSSTPPPRV